MAGPASAPTGARARAVVLALIDRTGGKLFALGRQVLRRAVGGHEARHTDGRPGARGAEAGRIEFRPVLLCTVVVGRADFEAVGLGERTRHAGFDLRRKARQNGEGGGDASGNSDG